MLRMQSNSGHAGPEDVEVHRNAYNAAFYELGLRWHWDSDTYQSLLPTQCERERIQVYLKNHHPHLLNAYDAEFIIEAIQAAKQRCYQNMAECGNGTYQFIDWAELHRGEIGI